MAFNELDKISRNELTADLDSSIGRVVTKAEWEAMITSGEITDASTEVYNIVDDAELVNGNDIANSVLDRVNEKMGNYYTKEEVDTQIDSIDSTLSSVTEIVRDDGIVASPNADFAEIGEWSDGNPDGEDRTGYFVCIDKSEPGKTMKKATRISNVRGATMASPAFIANATRDKFDSEGNLLPRYSYVGFAGFVPVIDNGRCTVNERCMPDDDGTAIPSGTPYGYQVIDRIDDNHVLLLIEPQGDTIKRIMDELSSIYHFSGSFNDLTDVPESFTATAHTHTKSDITDFPNSMPASDVYDWAKQETKPQYSWNEIINKPDNFAAAAHDHNSSNITALTGYTKPLSTSAITVEDSLNTAIGKLEKALDSKQGSGSYVTTDDSRLTDARTPTAHTHTKSEITDFAHTHDDRYYTESEIDTKLNTKLNISLKGAASGLAELDENGKVPSTQLPSYVDDVLEYSAKSAFPATGESGKIYISQDDNKTYRWSGSAYIEISSSLALGETSSTAYRGDRGKVAYDHSQSTHARTDATKVEASTTNGNIKINGTETTVYTHPSGTNPHGTTKADVGLGNVGNFKAVSTVANQGLTDDEKANARANIGAGASSFSGSYNDLSNKPTIPTKLSQLTNDTGFITSSTAYTADAGIKLNGTTFQHTNAVTAATAQGDASKTLAFGGTFTIPTVTYDAQGHITAKGTTTMTMPTVPLTTRTWGTTSPATTLNRWCKIASVEITYGYGEYHAVIMATEHEVDAGSIIFDWDCSVNSNANSISQNRLLYIGGVAPLATTYINTFYTEAIAGTSSTTFNLWCRPLANYHTFSFSILNESKNGSNIVIYDKSSYTTTALTGLIGYCNDVLDSNKIRVNNKVTLQYNSSTESLNFVFA